MKPKNVKPPILYISSFQQKTTVKPPIVDLGSNQPKTNVKPPIEYIDNDEV